MKEIYWCRAREASHITRQSVTSSVYCPTANRACFRWSNRAHRLPVHSDSLTAARRRLPGLSAWLRPCCSIGGRENSLQRGLSRHWTQIAPNHLRRLSTLGLVGGGVRERSTVTM